MRVSGRKQRRRICQPPLELPFRIVFTAFTAFAVIYSGDMMKNDMISLRWMFAASYRETLRAATCSSKT
ncbi:hypothetical protein HF883_13600 [Cloacibacillus porcorum]|uniref:hypothetical protein n=1 Tax=Cloacibacillus porcorum TaxID=1197717 RepID=UPI0014599596|nr:hypothetical protein [Cloacibacillus porcorum]MDY5389172.1 hypothetical protein [Cloacibacillus porcorum]NMF19247.1 hypothetical protein [Cloacibacillus porcorum]